MPKLSRSKEPSEQRKHRKKLDQKMLIQLRGFGKNSEDSLCKWPQYLMQMKGSFESK